MMRPDRRMPQRFLHRGEVVTFVRECGEGLLVRRYAAGIPFLVFWEEIEEAPQVPPDPQPITLV